MRQNFLVTFVVSWFAAASASLYIILKVPPNRALLLVLLALIGYSIAVLSAFVLYKFAKPRGYESGRLVFRRQLRKGFVVGLFIIVLLLVQKFFDIL